MILGWDDADGGHHFDVIEDLVDPTSKLTEAFIGHPIQGIPG
ncbi:MAG: hypothetical protein ACREEP_06345 [Dongiaceae bacterium]